MFIKNILAAITMTLTLSACLYNPVANHNGSIASLTDSTQRLSNTKVEFYTVNSVNGNALENGLKRGGDISTGRSNKRQSTTTLSRGIPADQPIQIEIAGTLRRVLGFRSTLESSRDISGVITFTAEPNKNYRVNGELNDSYRAVWIEDTQTGEVVSDKIEILGSDPERSPKHNS